MRRPISAPRSRARDPPMILHAGRPFDARRHVDAERPHAVRPLGDVVGRQPAGKHDPPLRGNRRGGRPIDRPPRAAAPHRDRGRRAEASRAPARRRARSAETPLERQRLDDRPSQRPATSATVSSPCSCTAPSRTRLATPPCTRVGWFTNTPTAVTNGGRRLHDRAGAIRIDEPRAVRPEHEPERVGPGLDRGLRVVEPRDAANLHQHEACHSRAGSTSEDTMDTKAKTHHVVYLYVLRVLVLFVRAALRAALAGSLPGSAAVMNRSPIRNAR